MPRRGFLNFPTSDFSLLPDLPNCQGWTSWLLWITQRYATAIPYLCSVAACKTLSSALRPQRSDKSSESDSTDDAQATLRLVDFAAKHFHGANSPKLVTACEFLTVAIGVLFSDNATCQGSLPCLSVQGPTTRCTSCISRQLRQLLCLGALVLLPLPMRPVTPWVKSRYHWLVLSHWALHCWSCSCILTCINPNLSDGLLSRSSLQTLVAFFSIHCTGCALLLPFWSRCL